MRFRRALPFWSAALAVLFGAGVASANTDIQVGVPNSACLHCHTEPAPQDGKGLTGFGRQFTGLEAMPSRTEAAAAKWADIATIDHDCDDVSSGLELGDCGTGTAERTTGISNPSDPSDATMETAPACEVTEKLCASTGAGPAVAHPDFPQGVCAVERGAGAGGSRWSLAALAAGAAALLAGRRRAR